jgi:peroxiredoxin
MDESAKKVWMTLAQLLFVGAAAIAVFGFVTVAREGEKRRTCTASCLIHPDYAGAERRLPSFTLTDMTGAKVSTDNFKGNVVVLNFWTKTCGPCLEEMPSIADLARIVKPKGDVLLFTISTDEGPEDVRDTLRGVLGGEAPFPVLFDPDGTNVVNGKFGTHLFPETWIIDKNGIIRARFDGGREWTNPAVVELIDQLRAGDFCPLKVDKRNDTSDASKRFCDALSGS